MYVLGMDVGGTKTHCAIADEKGNIVAEGFGGAGNYQTCGIETAINSWKTAIHKALEVIGGKEKEIRYGVFGMSGADEESDFAILNPAVASIMGNIPFEIYHDSWIGLRSVSEENVGVVSICGTGSGHAGRNKKGETVVLRNLDYPLGNYGGGGDLIEKGLHYAFRSDEETFIKTSLEQAIMEIFGSDTMNDVCNKIRQNGISDEQEYRIPIAIFKEAQKGDPVASMLIRNMGEEEGRFAAGVLRRLGMQEEKVPVVLIGGLFATREPLLTDSFMKIVNDAAPFVYPVIPDVAPVTGAIKLALEKLG